MGDSDQGWSEIEQFIAGIDELAQRDISFGEFAGELLTRITELLAAVGGGVWLQQPSGLLLQCAINGEWWDAPAPTTLAGKHESFLHSVLQAGEARISRSSSGSESGELTTGGSNYLWLAAPFRVDGEVVGLLEVLQPPELSVTLQQGNLKLLSMVCELTGDFIRRQQLRQLRQVAAGWQQYESLVERVLASLELRQTAFQLVNEGRSFIGCDRVSLLVSRRGELRMLAISGVDTFDSRSHSVRSMEILAKLVVQTGKPLQYPGDAKQLPPQLEDPLADYLDASHVQCFDLIPLYSAPLASASPSTSPSARDPLGVLSVEQFGASGHALGELEVARLANLASFALRNALDYDTLPLRSVASRIRQVSQSWPLQRSKGVVVAACVVVVGLALALIPARFYIRAEGELLPAERREIYAPLDGEVVEVRGQHDEDVEHGQVLLVMRSRPLEIELQRLQGEYQTTAKRLDAVASARFQTDTESSAAGSYPGELAAEEQELKQLLMSQQKQIQLVREQANRLSVQSPIQGRILTWNAHELLQDRPVQKGQLLMSTANIRGPWVLELSVPERRVGYLVAAQRTHNAPLDVAFALTSDRGTIYRGQVTQVAARTDVSNGQPPSVKVTATVPEMADDLLRPGATIRAKIDCGVRSLGFVWLHDIFETVKARLLL